MHPKTFSELARLMITKFPVWTFQSLETTNINKQIKQYCKNSNLWGQASLVHANTTEEFKTEELLAHCH